MLWLTKGWIRVSGGKFTGLKILELPDQTNHEVATFSHCSDRLLGQVTLFNTTIINEIVFEDPELLNYVIYHEYAHKKQWYRYALYPLFIIFIPILPTLPIFAIFILVDSVINFSLSLLISFLILVVIWLIPFGYSWFLEFLADYQAIKKMSPERVSSAIQRAHERRLNRHNKRSRLDRCFESILIILTHPPLSLTLRMYRIFHKIDSKNTQVP